MSTQPDSMKKFIDEFKDLTTKYYHEVVKTFQTISNKVNENEKMMPIPLGDLVNTRTFCEKLAAGLTSKKSHLQHGDIADLIRITREKYGDYFRGCYDQKGFKNKYKVYENIFTVKLKNSPYISRALKKYLEDLNQNGQAN